MTDVVFFLAGLAIGSALTVGGAFLGLWLRDRDKLHRGPEDNRF